MISYRWFVVPLIILGAMFVYDSLSYKTNQQVEGVVVRTYIKVNNDSKSKMAELHFGNIVESQSIGSKAFSVIRPGDRLFINSGKITGAWMVGDVYRLNQLIAKDLKLNRTPVFLIGIFMFMLSLLAFVRRSWLGSYHGWVIKRPIVVFGGFSLVGVLYYVAKMLIKLPHNRTAQKSALHWTRHCVVRLWAGR